MWMTVNVPAYKINKTEARILSAEMTLMAEEGEEERTFSQKKPACRYGSECYRKDPDHIARFIHPIKSDFLLQKRSVSLKGSLKAAVLHTSKAFVVSTDARDAQRCSQLKERTMNVVGPSGNTRSSLPEGSAHGDRWKASESRDPHMHQRVCSTGVAHVKFHITGAELGLGKAAYTREAVQGLATLQLEGHAEVGSCGRRDATTRLVNAEYFNQSPSAGSPIMVLLGGPPGSGKSTFSSSLVQLAARPWTRVCQDIAAKGNRGTRKQCLVQAKTALASGRSVLIDRCNMDPEQRADFVQLARAAGAEVHAVFLSLPLSVCIARATARHGHEGGLEGPKAEGVVKRQQRGRRLPALEEGFGRITICRTDAEVATALALYSQLAPDASLPGVVGSLGKKGSSAGGRTQLAQPGSGAGGSFSPSPQAGGRASEGGAAGKERRPPGADGPVSQRTLNGWRGKGSCALGWDGSLAAGDPTVLGGGEPCAGGGRGEEGSLGRLWDLQRPGRRHNGGEGKVGEASPSSSEGATGGRRPQEAAGPQSSSQEGQEASQGGVMQAGGPTGPSLADRCPAEARAGAPPIRLAFPSLSTADFKFDHERAASVIVETVSEFLESEKSAGLGLVLVDLSPASVVMQRVRRKAQEGALDPARFQQYAGDITKLHSEGGPHCAVIANAANWRLKEGGGGVNAAIHKAAGPALLRESKRRAQTLTPGSALTVPLPPTSPLRAREGVTHVIHVLGPNMNPQRPHCLDGDYGRGVELLRSAYRALFASFARAAGEERDGSSGEGWGAASGAAGPSLGNAGTVTGPGGGGGAGSSGLARSDMPRQPDSVGGGESVTGVTSRGQLGGQAKGSGHPVNAFAVMMQAAKRREGSKAGPMPGGKRPKLGGAEPGASPPQACGASAGSEPGLREGRGSAGTGGASGSGGAGGTGDDGNGLSATRSPVPVEGHREADGSGGEGGGGSGGGGSQLMGKRRPGESGAEGERPAGQLGMGGEDRGSGGGWGGSDGEGDRGGRGQRGAGAGGRGGWAEALRDIVRHPERHRDSVLEADELAVVVRDLYPKAKQHLLVVSRRDGLDRIVDARREDVALLVHMQEVGEKWAAQLRKEEPALTFRLGYHLVPSLRQLHLHVISQDFDSPHLKNRKHWNSFTTPFFLDSRAVLAAVERNGAWPAPSPEEGERLLKQELRCHRCRSVQPNLPRLKMHIKGCAGPAMRAAAPPSVQGQ